MFAYSFFGLLFEANSGMETYSISVFIIYGTQTYTLDIPSLFTVRQLKEVLSVGAFRMGDF